MISKAFTTAVFFTLLTGSFAGNASPQRALLQTHIVFEEAEVPHYESSVKDGKVALQLILPSSVRKAESLDSKNGSGSILSY